MKTIKISAVLILCSLIMSIGHTQMQSLPDVELYTMEGTSIDAKGIFNNEKPMVMIFWKSTVKECCNQLNMLNEVYEDFFREKGVRVLAICVDCTGSMQHVKPFVYGHDFNFEVFIDKNGDFKRSMSVPEVPYTLLFDQDMNIFCRHIGYCESSEDLLCEKIEKCLAKSEKEEIAFSE